MYTQGVVCEIYCNNIYEAHFLSSKYILFTILKKKYILYNACLCLSLYNLLESNFEKYIL